MILLFQIFILSQKKTLGQELMNKVFEHLNLLERDYFSLSYRDGNDVKVGRTKMSNLLCDNFVTMKF